MHYLMLQVHKYEYFEELSYCFVPLCEQVCRFVISEGRRFLGYMLHDRFHVASILWQDFPALYWYESLPASIASIAEAKGLFLLDARDDFNEEIQVIDLPDSFSWPDSQGYDELLMLSNANFVAPRAPQRDDDLLVLWSAQRGEGAQGYDYHSAALPLFVFEQYLTDSLRLRSQWFVEYGAPIS
jgi:hypothetical protein